MHRHNLHVMFCVGKENVSFFFEEFKIFAKVMLIMFKLRI
jgi:hypothetical protein